MELNLQAEETVSQPVETMHGGVLVAQVLRQQGVLFLFTLCGGHISPILVAAKALGIRVIDTRHEAAAVFAADAVARLMGAPGVAAVTAGPGLTNTMTAVKNAQLAQSPVVLLGGTAPTLLQGRGALQDIDQMALMRPHVKWAQAVRTVREIAPTLTRAFAIAQSGIPGPVFVELPIDVLYPEAVTREWTTASLSRNRSLTSRLTNWYVQRHVNNLFARAWTKPADKPTPVTVPAPAASQVQAAARLLAAAQRPVLIVGSQAMLGGLANAAALRDALVQLGIPTYLSGMGRGLLGRQPLDGPHTLHKRHGRSQAMKEADLIILAGVPNDFRLKYGRYAPRRTPVIAANRSAAEMRLNRKPTLGIQADAALFLRALAAARVSHNQWAAWQETLSQRDSARDADIAAQAATPTDYVNPIQLCRALEEVIDEDSVIVGDGGDFVATASYIVRPRAPLSWLDPGVFGTLGVGGGFALGAKLCRPQAEVWVLYGDGSAAYSLAEFDTFCRHNLPIIAVIGNDAAWSQIARDQVELLGDSVGTDLVHAAYHQVAQGYGGIGLLIERPEDLLPGLRQAKALARQGNPVLVNVLIGRTEFRKGSISM